MSGLSASRHAPRQTAHPTRNPTQPRGRSLDSSTTPSLTITPTAAPTSSGTNSAHHHRPRRPSSPHAHAALELNRYTKIVRRLKWKLPFLSLAYRAAVGPSLGQDVAEAELMFKMDFFEYYMLVERALVHLLGVFGITVSRGGGGGGGRGRADGGSSSRLPLSGSRWGGNGEHRYHANVLAALDSRENPLRAALGTGEVRHQLRRAKDLRNRWKTAGEEDEEEGDGGSPRKRAVEAALLESYDLERILSCIFDGFDEAFLLAEAYVYGEGGGMDVDAEVEGTEEEQWEFMVEAMDWEAV
ncbi:hypothetical protein B0T18DRAFT_400265 [Schizothecium vesticola]|uniref:Fungal specific transcription factor n=1 Tax=Schizothecium vesticola TaxID=314040 RepID=A0AA40FBT9_9PEZI|nr:hypothetical protein B0T18DRAFT_400265 [Schizothecium vesticola]